VSAAGADDRTVTVRLSIRSYEPTHEEVMATSRRGVGQRILVWDARAESDALENLCTAYSAATKYSAPPCHDGSRTDEASRPVRRHVAIRGPVP
jgi:hypothetical protein